jgi:hypothetical protein
MKFYIVEVGAVVGGAMKMGAWGHACTFGGTVAEGCAMETGAQACACAFAVVDNALGLAHLPDLSPPAYGSL